MAKSDREVSSPIGSLAFRVLFINLLFVILPLIIYTALSFQKSYSHRVDNIYQELRIIEHEQQRYIKQLMDFHLDFLSILEGFYQIIGQNPEAKSSEIIGLDKLLRHFSKDVNVAAILQLSVTPKGRVGCVSSTVGAYTGIDFTPYFARVRWGQYHDPIFFARDPIHTNSLYINHFVYDPAQKRVTKVLSSVLPVEELVGHLGSIKQSFSTNVSIINRHGEIIGSTEPDYLNRKVQLSDKEAISPEGVMKLHASKDRERGYTLNVGGEKRYALVTKIPYTESYIMSSVPKHIVMEQMNEFLVNMAILFLSLLVIGGLLSVFFTLRMSKPLKQLIRIMKEIGAGNRHKRFVSDKLGFEMNFIGLQLNETLRSLNQHIEQEQEEKTQKELWHRELEIGHEIQKSMLPDEPFAFEGVDLAYSYQPAQVVAGDFYEWVAKEESFLVIIADGVGKGISGCLYAFDLRSIIKTCATTEDDLHTILSQANKLFLEDTKDTGSFVTAFVFLYDKESHKITYGNCGHPFPLLKRADGSVEVIKSRGMAFGLSEDFHVDIQEYTLQEGETLMLYTDGVTDAQNSEKAFFGEQRIKEVLLNSTTTSSNELLMEMHDAIERFTDQQALYDDMTIIILKRTLGKQMS